MTLEELRIAIADRVEQEFDGTKRRDDGEMRPSLDRKNCDFIADILFSEVARQKLGIVDPEQIEVQDVNPT